LTKEKSLEEMLAYIKEHKEELFSAARKNSKYDSEGRMVISRDDPWFHDNVWDNQGSS